MGIQKNHARLRKLMQDDIKKYGFHVHYILHHKEGFADYHTHGLVETFGHPELQIVMRFQFELAGGIFHDVVNEIRKGKKFEPGKEYENILKGMPIRISAVPPEPGEDERVRILFPDAQGKFGAEAEHPYSKQETFDHLD